MAEDEEEQLHALVNLEKMPELGCLRFIPVGFAKPAEALLEN